jgi:O-antigen ligase
MRGGDLDKRLCCFPPRWLGRHLCGNLGDVTPQTRLSAAMPSANSNMKTTPPASSNRIASYLVFTTLACAPLPFGSEDAAIIAAWCVLLGIAAISASVRGLGKPQQALLLGIGFIAGCYGFVLHEQLSDRPWVASPEPLWEQTSGLLGVELTPSISIAKYEPFYSLGPPLAAILALTLGLIVGSDRYRGRQLLLVVGWSGAAYALYGILNAVIAPTMLLWRERHSGAGYVTGTFVNENTAAAYFGSCVAIWLPVLSERIRERLPKGPLRWKDFSQHFLSRARKKTVLAFSALFICFMALLMTGSRAGVSVSILTLVIAFTIYFRRDLPTRSNLALLVASATGVALLFVQLLGGGVNQHFDIKGLSDEGRIAAYRSTLHMIADHPWFGTGLGTFAWGFPRYRSADDTLFGVWDLAHSTPLELAADVGVPLATVIGAGWILILALLIRAVRRRRRDGIVVPLAALSVALIGLLHSMVDFSLQIPGYAIVACGVVGAGLAQSFGPHSPK